jgi:hypothetical protein
VGILLATSPKAPLNEPDKRSPDATFKVLHINTNLARLLNTPSTLSETFLDAKMFHSFYLKPKGLDKEEPLSLNELVKDAAVGHYLYSIETQRALTSHDGAPERDGSRNKIKVFHLSVHKHVLHGTKCKMLEFKNFTNVIRKLQKH